MKKELFKIFGPLICAFLLLEIFLGLPIFNRGKISKEKDARNFIFAIDKYFQGQIR